MATIEQLFARSIPIPFSGCWVWEGRTLWNGYGIVSSGSGRPNILAHRLAYELVKGPIPDGLQIDHLCRVRGCLNPDHLEAVTASANVRRGRGPAVAAEQLRAFVIAKAAAVTHCPQGHEYTPENTYQHNGMRTCKECQRRRNREARVRRKLSKAPQ